MAKKPILLNVTEAAELLGISVQKVRKYTDPAGPIPAVREGRRVFYPKTKLEAFRKAQVKANKSLEPKRGRRSVLETIS